MARRLQQEEGAAPRLWAPDMHPSEVATTAAYHGTVGLILSSGPLFATAVGYAVTKSHIEGMFSQTREAVQATQANRLKCIECRKSKTPSASNSQLHSLKGSGQDSMTTSANLSSRARGGALGRGQSGTGAAVANASVAKGRSNRHSKRMSKQSAISADHNQQQGGSTEQDAEMCAVCQFDFEHHERVLACKTCDNGFHVRCLNEWLSRATTCPCCRTVIS